MGHGPSPGRSAVVTYARQQLVVPSRFVVNGVLVNAAALENPNCAKCSPSRDRVWEVQRIRLALIGGGYTVYTGLSGIAQNSTGSQDFACAGVWKNSLQPENEVLWVGCVPPGKSEYAPQQPVTITEYDVLIAGVANAALLASSNNGFVIRFDFDVDEAYKPDGR